MPGTVFDAGGLVLLPFPFYDLTSNKMPPGADSDGARRATGFSGLPGNLARRVGSRSPAFAARSDRRRSAAGQLGRTDKVGTLHMGLIVRRFGRVTAAFRATIAAEVCRFLDAPPAVVAP